MPSKKKWPGPIQISFNMSAGDLLNEALGEAIAHRLEEMQTDPAWLKAELTESVITEDLGKADSRLKELQRLGSLRQSMISVPDFVIQLS
jgi:EAL domain-containing protein (putative c-di-GMP-specific phosphodiesterase class I)